MENHNTDGIIFLALLTLALLALGAIGSTINVVLNYV